MIIALFNSWAHPQGSTDVANYESLLSDIKKALITACRNSDRSYPYLLTAMVGYSDVGIPAIAQTVDYFNLWTYVRPFLKYFRLNGYRQHCQSV